MELEKIRETIAPLLKTTPEKLGDSVSFREDLDADSLDLIQVISALEDLFAIRIDEAGAVRLDTVPDAMVLVDEARAQMKA
ncbi:MAG: acyl carrier protein [Lachnospiraceae bacterium]|jgi:acyl carrier protein|nr:acyl carrier protein [Lachnospiraceae bacterium]MBR7015146.1 acyl carrier protein [Lachnospiraceae bacterium]MEE1110004.1 phosphopantetheine-binding protein [Lachnospiraceae bacterium]MEE3377161.1 phosphopantetheine-binding protein [Lachnospiraceae bacterium]MEE3436991.1 phosphopantetheine-binding protein [Lachnospiraceae bacterium]